MLILKKITDGETTIKRKANFTKFENHSFCNNSET
jgi:hypothetical protein